MKRLTAAALLLALAGCSGRVRTYPVSGEVYVDGKPAEGAFVFLHPDGGQPPDAPRPFAQADAEGRFALSSYVSGDGAAAGEYVVCFEWRERSGLLKQNFDGPDRLHGKFYDKATSTHRVTIEKKPNTLPRFDLQTPK